MQKLSGWNIHGLFQKVWMRGWKVMRGRLPVNDRSLPDFLEQTIDYRVPIHLYDDITAFDGSTYLDRTKGEATAMCDKEAMNFLALNLMHEIAKGQRDVEGAKMFLAQTAYMYLEQNVSSPYTEGLIFPKQYNTADPGMIYFE